MWQSFLIVSLAVFAVSCNRCCQQGQPVSRYYEDGMAKPVVALAPIIDTSSCEVPWSLTEELSQLFSDRLSARETLYFTGEGAENLSSSENPFGNDLSWAKTEFAGSEFVVFMEVVEHDVLPVRKTADYFDSTSNLNVGIRIRIVDIRGNEPKVVLQELVRESYNLSHSFAPFDYNKMPWGTEEFNESPMGVAHDAIAKGIADRINDYVLIAKSR